MINSLKTIAVFGSTFTSRYRRGLCAAFSKAAEELGVNLVYLHSLGKIGNKNPTYGLHEADIFNYVDLSCYSGIIFDGEGYTMDNVRDDIIRRLHSCNVPVVSISSYVEGFYNVDFNDAEGIAILTKHFLDVHHFTKIGFMSGYLTHPDAQVRLKKFREVMLSRGLPEDGAGIFEGDFWFNKGEEAADYFLSLPERPEAIVCANDFMAVALVKAFRERGISVPDDIAISGFDGTLEGKECIPHITSATRERYDIAKKSLQLIIDISNGGNPDSSSLHILPAPIYTHSCGCQPLDYRSEALNNNAAYELTREMSYNIYGTESSILSLNQADDLDKLQKLFTEEVFRQGVVNIGEYSSLFVMLHCDRSGNPSSHSNYTAPSGYFVPAIWIDKEGQYIRPEMPVDGSEIVPQTTSEKPHFYFLMSVHCAERAFGYALIEMTGYDIFNEFYNMWLMILSMQLETLLKNDRIQKLITRLEELSISDGLTGMLNRRGFEENSQRSLQELNGTHTVCTMVIDMDGLKRINDQHGHFEGDNAIKALADMIIECCVNGEIAGRAGGDEFYIYAADYSEEKLTHFITDLTELTSTYNDTFGKPYKIEISWGAYLTEADNTANLDELIKVSDKRMYEQKMSKPNKRH